MFVNKRAVLFRNSHDAKFGNPTMLLTSKGDSSITSVIVNCRCIPVEDRLNHMRQKLAEKAAEKATGHNAIIVLFNVQFFNHGDGFIEAWAQDAKID